LIVAMTATFVAHSTVNNGIIRSPGMDYDPRES
jgi:hypothetical protein